MNRTTEQIIKFFGDENTPVAVSTVSDNEPKVRFMSFKMVENDRIYFITSKSKNIYKELSKNTNIELCSLPSKDKEWVRVNGKVIFVRDIALNKKAFEILPMLKMAYGDPENDKIALFYIEDLKATKYGMGTKPEIL